MTTSIWPAANLEKHSSYGKMRGQRSSMGRCGGGARTRGERRCVFHASGGDFFCPPGISVYRPNIHAHTRFAKYIFRLRRERDPVVGLVTCDACIGSQSMPLPKLPNEALECLSHLVTETERKGRPN
jgi:hypothetical protein